MSGILLPGQSQRSSIVTQTRERWGIPNCQSVDTSVWDQRNFDSVRVKYPRVKFRTGLVPCYNCHGLTFAARRTAIADASAISRILRDDRYEEVPTQDVQPGDIILYVALDSGDVEHSGVVVGVPEAPFWVPMVWSKWGFGAEAVHWAHDCPYDFRQARYYRIRS